MSFADEMIEVAKELLDEFGMVVTISRPTTSGFNTVTLTPTNGSPLTFAGQAAPFDPSNSNLTGYEKSLLDDATLTHKWFYLTGAQQVKTGDTIVSPGGKRYLIKAMTEIGIAEQIVYNRVASTQV